VSDQLIHIKKPKTKKKKKQTHASQVKREQKTKKNIEPTVTLNIYMLSLSFMQAMYTLSI